VSDRVRVLWAQSGVLSLTHQSHNHRRVAFVQLHSLQRHGLLEPYIRNIRAELGLRDEGVETNA
jgi:hypothetical protein